MYETYNRADDKYNTFPYMIGLVSPKVHSIQSAVAQLQYILSFSSCFTTTSLILSHASAVLLRQVQTLLLQSISLSFVSYTSLVISGEPISVTLASRVHAAVCPHTLVDNENPWLTYNSVLQLG